jgi:FSR family fosmidomycin resistance protein-like MFS transporter
MQTHALDPETAAEPAGRQTDNEVDRVQLITLSAGHTVIDSYGHTLLAPMFPIIRERLHLSLDQIGALPIIMGLTASLAQPFMGMVTDRWPRVPAVALAPAVAGIFMGLVSFAGGYPTLAACLFLAGIGVGAYHPQGASLASRAARGRGLAMSTFTVGGNIGFGLAPLLGALYFKCFGLERFYLAALPGLVFAAVMFWLLRRPGNDLLTPLRHGRHENDRRGNYVALALLTGTVSVRAAAQIATSTFLPFLLRERISGGPFAETDLAGLSLALFLLANAVSGPIGGHTSTFPPFLLRERISGGPFSETDLAGLSLALFLLANAVSGPIGGHLSDRIGRKTVMLISLAAAPFVFSFALMLPGYWMVIGLAAAGFVLMLPHPANVVMAQEYAPANVAVAASMITGLAWSIGQLMSWPLGAMAERIGVASALHTIYWLPLAGVLLTLPLHDPRPKQVDRLIG